MWTRMSFGRSRSRSEFCQGDNEGEGTAPYETKMSVLDHRVDAGSSCWLSGAAASAPSGDRPRLASHAGLMRWFRGFGRSDRVAGEIWRRRGREPFPSHRMP